VSGVGLDQFDFVTFYDNPFLKLERLLETYLSYVPKGFTSFKMAMLLWRKVKLFQRDFLRKKLKKLDQESGWMNNLLF
jgi:carbamoyltransferase